MQLGRLIALWIARNLLSLALILFILIAGRYLLLPGWNALQQERQQAQATAAQTEASAEALARLRAYANERSGEAQARLRALPDATTASLAQRANSIPAEIAAHRQSLLSPSALALAGISGRSDRIFAHYRASAEIALLERERQSIQALLQVREGSGRRQALADRRRDAVARFNASRIRWQTARAEVVRLEQRPLAGARNALCRTVRPTIGCTHYRALRSAQQQRDSAWAENRSALATIRAVDRARSTLATAQAATADSSALIDSQVVALQNELRRLDKAAADNWIGWIRRPILEMLPAALLILALAIFGPALGKALLYFLIAPAASRRPALRLQPDERGEVDEALFRSAVSQRIVAGPGEELLVVPEAVQSSPHSGAKATQWFLNAAMPLSSLASGLVALVRFRGSGAIQVSATRDPLAEIAQLGIPSGSAMVVRPRALRGVIHPADSPVRVTRHWRLGLSAWLTLQFRYIVFHGPCTLLIQGSRGVRLERSAEGRGVNRAATLAFSAGLDFAVRRSEAFAPYLMGRQDLLNHSFSGARGFLVYEEMPRSGQRAGLWGRGLAGVGDSLLKTVGL